MQEELVGIVTHYFAKPQVGALKLEAEIRVGDLLRFRGHTTDFEQEVGSLQIDHVPVEQAGPGADVAVQVKERVRRHDRVYKLTP
ncbi:MAG: translation elongation factor-like protein [Gemmatimonadota bacterium]